MEGEARQQKEMAAIAEEYGLDPLGDFLNETEQIMPLTRKGTKVLSAMRKEYGAKKGTRVFYASVNKGTVKGAERRGGGGRKR
jgi:hypothetical protein